MGPVSHPTVAKCDTILRDNYASHWVFSVVHDTIVWHVNCLWCILLLVYFVDRDWSFSPIDELGGAEKNIVMKETPNA
jgi:hypothetical protein